MRIPAIFIVGLMLLGCSTGGVEDTDMAKARQGLSQENYEKAMIAAGKGAELEKEKAAAASRGEGQ